MNGPLEDLGRILPIVLAGGRSRRFGRDKLREPWGDGWLVDRPIAALRSVFGARVTLVGPCDPEVRARADGALEDQLRGAGPGSGIASAMAQHQGPVFVLSGDLPLVTSAVVEAILDAAGQVPAVDAVLARSDRPEPTIGLYRIGALPDLRRYVAAPIRPLADLLPAERAHWVAIDRRALTNANAPSDLESLRFGVGDR